MNANIYEIIAPFPIIALVRHRIKSNSLILKVCNKNGKRLPAGKQKRKGMSKPYTGCPKIRGTIKNFFMYYLQVLCHFE